MPKQKQRRDPIADYIEWTNNRYNPGHYLGGNIPPYLRKSDLSPKGRRLEGVSLAISALLGLGSIAVFLPWAEEFSNVPLVLSAAFVALIGWAAIAMFRSACRPSSKGGRLRKNPK